MVALAMRKANVTVKQDACFTSCPENVTSADTSNGIDMDALTLRPRTASELADAAINLYRANGRLFLVIGATMTLPILILMVLFMPSVNETSGGALAVRFTLIFASALWSGVVSGALAYAISERYLGRNITAQEAIRAALQRWGRLAFGLWARWLLVSFGAILLLVGAVYAFIFSFAMIPVIILEKQGINAAWTRSRELARGMKGHVFGALCIAYLVLFVVFVTVAFMLGGMLFGTNERALQVMQSGVQIVVSPFVVATEVLLYYDLRIRKEGFDIEHMAASMDQPPAAAPRVAPRF